MTTLNTFRLLLSMSLLTSACAHLRTQESSYGINPARTGFIPARIALVACMPYPDTATRILNIPPTNRPASEIQSLCEDFNKYIADGFDNQPFMKGLSTKLVEKLYSATQPTATIQETIKSEWRGLSSDCQNCENLPTLYNTSVKSRRSWLVWLNKLSVAARGADAILIPILLSENTRVNDDRGILQSIRNGAIAMLLIDTNDGSLIWSGGRESEVIFRALINTTTKEEIGTPSLDDLKRRLFTEAVWIGFPGRQIYR